LKYNFFLLDQKQTANQLMQKAKDSKSNVKGKDDSHPNKHSSDRLHMSSDMNRETHEHRSKPIASSASHETREQRTSAQPSGQTSNSATGASRLPKNVRNNSDKELSAVSKSNPTSLPNSHSQSAIHPVLNEV